MSKDTFFKRQTSGQPGWAKGVENVILIGGAALAVYLIYKNARHNKEIAEANTAAEQAGKDLSDLENLGILPTLYDTEYENFSQELVQAMNGCGTDEASIYSVFGKMANDADVLKLIQAFGVRYYQPCVWTSPVSYTLWLANDQAFGGGLPAWLGYDLDASEIAKVNSILRSKQISFQF